MKLAEVCIRRPVFTVMLVTVLVVLGIYAYRDIGVDLFPKVDFPTVTIRTTLEGASPEEVETEITKPIEEVVNTINGVDELRSISTEGASTVIVQFVLEKDVEIAANDVRDRVATIISQFPAGTDPPVIEKFDPDASPVMSISVSGRRDLREITEIADKKIKQELESIQGVGSITIYGGREREIQVWLDRDRLSANRISVQQVKAALIAQNLEIPGGRVDEGRRELILRTMGRLQRPKDFERLVVARVNGMPLRISDLGYVEDGVVEPRSLSRLDGEQAVTLFVRKQSGTNTVKVVEKVKKKLEELKGLLPPDIVTQVIRDQSLFINQSIHEIQQHLILGAILAGLVVLLFLRNFRSTLIAATAIPISIVTTFVLMKSQGFTLNNMTMLGLSLAVGIVIDDAIVVLENIYRHVEEGGQPPMEAANIGTSEIALAVSATTLSLMVIFLPVAFMGHLVGRFMYHFGMTMAFAIGVSWFVAFTLTPMLCSRFLKPGTGGKTSKESRFYSVIERSYMGLLSWSLNHRALLILIALAAFLTSYPLFKGVGKDVVPYDDQNEFEVFVQAPEGTSLAASDSLFKELEDRVGKLRGVSHLLATIGAGGTVNEGSIYVKLLDLKERKFSQFDVMRDARRMLKEYPWLRTSVQNVSAIRGGGFRQTPINFNLRGPELKEMDRISEQITAGMRKISGIVDVDTTLANRKPELRVIIDRDKAADLGVQVGDIASSLNIMVGGEEVTKYKEADEQYDVRVRVQPGERNSPADVSRMFVSSNKGDLVRLENIVRLEEEKGPAQIDRQARQRQVTIVANLEGKPLGQAISEIKGVIREVDMPPGYSSEFTGRGKWFAEFTFEFTRAFIMAFLFMYMVLAAQFESFIHPFTIMLSLPVTVPFALVSLWATGKSVDIYSALGILLLFGIVKKNSILQVDYTNALRRRGLERSEAILQANRTRLRPILMTTITLVVAMIPLALGKGAGAASRAATATAVIGGQSLALILTLLVVPVGYTIMDDLVRLKLFRRLKEGVFLAWRAVNNRKGS